MESFLKLNGMNNVDGKLLVLHFIELNEACESLYLSKTT
jgi:hypothetical protein